MSELFPTDIVVHNRETYLSHGRAAALADCCTLTITKRVRDGSLPSYKLPRSGRMKFVKQADVVDLIEREELRRSQPETYQVWTDAEIVTINDVTLTHAEASFLLGRPYDSISAKRSSLGIRTGRRQLVAA
ncbi:hypothetical protein [Rhodococcoides fascians]|uniref:hypothetical protein n=1 Tax=Rhodococcoides fascians TaxID=1828 RepID=UPI00050BE87F|nr:hypothetical protein [Rhodococcus fascians]